MSRPGAPPDAVFCFDDIEDGALATPSSSTVRPDLAAIATTAVDLLDRRLGGDDGAPREVVVGHRFVARESSVGIAG